jgi:flagellar protein FlaG
MLNNIVKNGPQPVIKALEPASKPAEELEKAEPAVQTEQPLAEPEPQELQSAVKKLNDYVQNIQRTLSFMVEETTGITVVQVFDTETDELIRQIPAEETIKLAVAIETNSTSLLFKEQA